jgi:hypothetical protein
MLRLMAPLEYSNAQTHGPCRIYQCPDALPRALSKAQICVCASSQKRMWLVDFGYIVTRHSARLPRGNNASMPHSRQRPSSAGWDRASRLLTSIYSMLAFSSDAQMIFKHRSFLLLRQDGYESNRYERDGPNRMIVRFQSKGNPLRIREHLIGN